VGELAIGHVVRLHAAVLGVLLATAMPAFAMTAPHVADIDGVSLAAGLALLALAARSLSAYRAPTAPQRRPGPASFRALSRPAARRTTGDERFG
jgi:hypothetical protein